MQVLQRLIRFARRSPREQLATVQYQMQVLRRLIRFARKSPRKQLATFQYHLGPLILPRWCVPHRGNDRTAYVIGLFGTGRVYVYERMLQNIGERAKYCVDGIVLHRGPTSMIYSGHATMRYSSRGQVSPAVTNQILEAVRSGFADLIFVHRHPLDSLLTNWVWWRTNLSSGRMILGISEVYGNTDDLCADLEQNFSEFEAFAAGDPKFFASAPGPPFLSFAEFVEETELFRQSATLTLRLEDF